MYSGSGRSAECDTAYEDVELPIRSCWRTACDWHFGLNSAECNGECNELISNHDGDQIAVGMPGSFSHAFSGRDGEDPSLQLWVR